MAHQFYFNPFILDNLPAPTAGFDVVQDVSEPRLRMYITSRGIKTFFVRKRVKGHDRRMIIGNYPDVDIEAARDAVNQVLEVAAQKIPVRRHKIKFKKLLDLYVENKVKRASYSMDKLLRAIDIHLHSLFEKNVSDISDSDIAQVISVIQGNAIARRMQDFLQSFFRYALELGYVKKNPVLTIPKIEQIPRKRNLNNAGLQKLIGAIQAEESLILQSAFLMLIYGFATKSEIFSMQWEDLDFNHYMWANRPVSDAAVVLLQNLPQDGRWVFPGRGMGHLTDPRTSWIRVCKAAGLPNLTMDDVHKFLTRQLIWSPEKESLRDNMNRLLDDVLAPVSAY